MFTDTDIALLRQLPYKVLRVNHHDATLHSSITGHDWIVVSSYGGPGCYILHRHTAKDPYHRQRGQYGSLREAMEYINRHEEWVAVKTRVHPRLCGK